MRAIDVKSASYMKESCKALMLHEAESLEEAGHRFPNISSSVVI